MPVDYQSHVPPYRQIAGRLRDAIRSGELQPNDRLPSIVTIMQTEGVARLTARKALAVLVDEGLAHRVPGWGTYVTDQQPSA